MINFLITFLMLFGADSAPVVQVSDWYEYVNSKRGARLGSIYYLLNLHSFCDKIAVKIPDEVSAIDQETLQKANASGQFIYCRIEQFTARTFARDNKVEISAKGEKITIVPNGNVK